MYILYHILYTLYYILDILYYIYFITYYIYCHKSYPVISTRRHMIGISCNCATNYVL